MDCTFTSIPYQQLGYFSNIIADYINESPKLRPFYQHPVSVEGIENAIAARKQFPVDRKTLVEVLQEQYKSVPAHDAVAKNIASLADENTFTLVTAHQPNIFTGYLYFIYKIVHIIRLADQLRREQPAYAFVPVFYMGSEDADLDELGKIFLQGEKIAWDTDQKGAVGRMHTGGLEKILARIEGELKGLPFGEELLAMLKEAYGSSPDVQTATFRLVNQLFAGYGLVVLIPDNARLKRSMLEIFTDDLLHQTPSVIVGQTIHNLSAHYKAQASPREINLFYLKDDIRERIVQHGDQWKVIGQHTAFTKEALLEELDRHPERFSPNVILRGLYQETILPNIAFVGGGGEMAYWLELKDLFAHYRVPFPLLMLRNSFLFVEKKWKERITGLGFTPADFFMTESRIIDELVKRDSGKQLQLKQEIAELANLYARIKKLAGITDVTLVQHVEALQSRSVNQLYQLEKKMLRAEKRKFEDQQRQVRTIKNKLFPNSGLQERVDNFMPYYAKFGPAFIQMIYENSAGLDQHFTVLTEN